MNSSSDDNHSSNEILNLKGIDRQGSIHDEVEAKDRLLLVQWLNSLLPSLDFSVNVTDGELRASLSNGTVLCQILNKLRSGSVTLVSESDQSLPSQSENVKTFLKALDGLGLPRFEISDLERGSMKPVVGCLLTLRAKSLKSISLGDNINISATNSNSTPSPHRMSVNTPPNSGGRHYSPLPFDHVVDTNKKKVSSKTRFPRVCSSPLMAAAESSAASLIHQVGPNFHEVFQVKPGSYADLPAAKISEMMKSNSLDNAPTQSLLSVVNGILDESVERRNGEIPHPVACLLRKVSQEIERRISTQAEHIRTQSNLFKAREEKYQSRIRVLEALSSGTREDSEIFSSQFQQLKGGEEDEKETIRLMKELEDKNLEISSLISALKQELEVTKETYETRCLRLEEEATDVKAELRQKSHEYEHLLEELRNKVKKLETCSDSKYQEWNLKRNKLQNTINFQFGSLQKLKSCWESIKQDVMREQTVYAEECINQLGVNLKSVVHAADGYQSALDENRKLFNEVQELKGNIRVYCRIKPFLSGKVEKQSIVEHIGESDLVVANPSKEVKDTLRSFKFNKIFGPASTQEDVYNDIQPFVRSVLDGYNACMFAYGQTGAGKTYTMTGPNGATSETLGVNYRALNDLFKISKSRASTIEYEIEVQMVEIYNEQVRDLLSMDGSPKRLGILTQPQSKGVAAPDASMFPVKTASDVIKLMDIGLKNRAIGATAMNQRSSRSHSVVSIHVRGKDLRSDSDLHGNLHLVDLAGSERVDRSEVTGDRLKEAQHINKSLSALGDVIFALSQKSSHVPYRNSKLTQLLQTSLGGQAKTLMFVQINSDVNSYSETVSTLKFGERVSGIELGAAKSNKESKDVRELMEQVVSLKNTIFKKDEEIDRLKSRSTLAAAAAAVVGNPKLFQKPLSGNLSRRRQSMDDSTQQQQQQQQNEFQLLHQSDINNAAAAGGVTLGFSSDTEFHERSSDISSDNGLTSVGTETDGSSDNSIATEATTKPSDNKTEKPKALPRSVQTVRKFGRNTSTTGITKESVKKAPVIKKSASIGHLRTSNSKRWQ